MSIIALLQQEVSWFCGALSDCTPEEAANPEMAFALLKSIDRARTARRPKAAG
jgi:hypothetical protein